MKAIITVGLGYGDEGKGSCTDYLCRHYDSKLVVRYCGGSQAGHNVVLPYGCSHCFSQFGSGTFAGAKTYLGKHVIVNPITLRNEARHLTECGIKFPQFFLSIHPQALVTTPYHQVVNRSKEVSRRDVMVNTKGLTQDLRHGSCGQGIGETRSYWLKYNKDSIFVRDLFGSRSELCDKLELIRQRLLEENYKHTSYSELYGKINKCDKFESVFNESVKDIAAGLVVNLYFEKQEAIPQIYDSDAPVIFEGAQGVLLDEWYGFHPYTTWSTVTPRFAKEMCEEVGIKDTYVLGITRTYMTRHGPGPFPTYSYLLTKDFQDKNNSPNEWQGGFRCGTLDIDLLKYSIECCGGIDGLAVNCCDQVKEHQLQLLAPVVLESFGPTHKDKKIYNLPWPPESRQSEYAKSKGFSDMSEVDPCGDG